MPRIRSIKPEFPQSESVGKMSRDARLLFIQLWTVVDDEGRARAASRMLASLLYPYDDDARELIEEWLAELERCDCIRRYVVDGSTYLEIINWLKHQKIDKPSKSKLPPFAEASRIVAKPREEYTTDQEEDQDQEKDQNKRADARTADPVQRETSPPALVGRPKGLPGKYAFEGDVIRLTRDNFDKWAKAFPNIDLRAVLTARDSWLAADAKDSDRERWFVSTSAYLKNENAKAMKQKTEFKWASGIEGVY